MDEILVWQANLRNWGATRLSNSPKTIIGLYFAWRLLRWLFIAAIIGSIAMIYFFVQILGATSKRR